VLKTVSPYVPTHSQQANQYTSGARLTYYKNFSVTCESNTPANCFCKSGSGANQGSTYSNVCCSTKVTGKCVYMLYE
jgi:hypothetical protein